MNNVQNQTQSQRLFRLFDALITDGASDLHLTVGVKPIIRVDGELTPVLKEETLTNEDVSEFLKIMVGPEKWNRFVESKELDFSYAYKNGDRFRGNAFVQKGTISIALRIIPKGIKTIQELELPDVLEEFARKEQGFFLVVGPVGQGKTTTLAALVELINQERATHIVTIEDPIEYIFEPKQSLIAQREVKTDTKDFETALKSVFREDIDVLLIGEMRGKETMRAAVSAAETGHLVFSTLHTNDAAQTVNRIIDSFPAEQQDQIRLQLASALNGIFSQRLVPRIGGGLVPVYELLIANKAVANLIREKRTYEINTVIETGMKEGMIDMNRVLAELVSQGEISVENAYRFATNPKALERML